MQTSSQVIIQLGAIAHNLACIKALAPKSAIMAIVKANAYGHGLVPATQALTQADGFAVTHLEEALTLRQAGIKQRLLLLGATLLDTNTIVQCSQHSIDIVIHELSLLQTLCRITLSQPITIWLKQDSGMHRLGLNQEDFCCALQQIQHCSAIKAVIAMTHLSSADESDTTHTLKQIDTFYQTVNQQPLPLSIANSAAILHYPDRQADWIRPGLMLYGAHPIPNNDLLVNDRPTLQAAMTLTAPVLALHRIKAGEGVGYNQRWVSRKDTQIATLGIGYGDGYPRSAQDGTPVLIHGQIVPLVGAVSMDMITVDIGERQDIKRGDTATLWGEGLAVETIAQHANTISHALLCGISPRVNRHYHD